MLRYPWGVLATLLVLAGCHSAVQEQIDQTVCELASLPRDLQPLSHSGTVLPVSPTAPPVDKHNAPPGSEESDKEVRRSPAVPHALQRVGLLQIDSKPSPDSSALTIPEELLPSGSVEPIRLPPLGPETEQERKAAIERLYPPLPPLGEDDIDPPGPEGRPLTLADLQQLALANSPLIRQATARVEEARGNAVQAGLPPNPNVGYEGDTMGTTGGAGYQGGFFEQTIKTANKLQLARAAAAIELRNAELDLYKTQADLATRVRSGYFAVLVAQESVRLNRGLVKFTTDVYRLQVEQVRRGGFAAPYEPMYLRALATQARANLVQARNRRTAAWKQLTATVGLPSLPPCQLAGRLDIPVPQFCYKDVLAIALSRHTNIRTAENAVLRAKYLAQLARITPVPDVNVRVMLQRDNTNLPYQLNPSVAVSFPIPIWDRNQGNILAAEAALARAQEEVHRVRNSLTEAAASAFERYQNNQVILGYYRDRILPDLVRVYRGVYDRYQREPAGAANNPPGFIDVVVAQQNLAAAVSTYITTLGQLWQSVVDVADLLQTFDLFCVQATTAVPAIPDLQQLPLLECQHRCSPLPQQHSLPPDGNWPVADPTSPALSVQPSAKPTDEAAKAGNKAK
jgi:cobalt-zinc-cadmium efflux system outer membrane protein